MKKCFMCGNQYAHYFEIRHNNKEYVFDCFECAIHVLAPHCRHCDCTIIGHGIEVDENHYYCCAHCAREKGHNTAKDHLKSNG